MQGLLKPKDKIPRYPTTTDTNTHTTNLNPSKSKPNTKSQNMPPKKPLPYHPNDYWDRTHFSTDHDHDHDRAHSPTHSISSLPTHPPNLGIPSSSAAGRSKRDEIPRPRGRGAERTYAQELQLRSRSPRVWKVAGTDGGRSASASGSFGISHKANTNTDPNSKRRISQGVSESSKSPVPNNPNDSEDNHNHTTVNENENTRPRTIRTVNETQPVELLGTKHDGHDEEEVVMSSTAYPGQEWRPAGLARWEDC